jgi:hypothetical protein
MIGTVDILKRQDSLTTGQLTDVGNKAKTLPQLNSNNFNQLRYLINVFRQISCDFININAILDSQFLILERKTSNLRDLNLKQNFRTYQQTPPQPSPKGREKEWLFPPLRGRLGWGLLGFQRFFRFSAKLLFRMIPKFRYNEILLYVCY